MGSLVDIANKLDEMLASNAPVSDIAADLCTIQATSRKMVAAIAMLSENALQMAKMEILRQWPQEHLDVFCEFIANIPFTCRVMPCGEREDFVVEALEARDLPTRTRVFLWRMLQNDAYVLPSYVKDKQTWDTVPKALWDHINMRGWIVRTRQDGWEDLGCSETFLFAAKSIPMIREEISKESPELLQAIEKDNSPDFYLPLNLKGKEPPRDYLLYAMAKEKKNIIANYLRLYGEKQSRNGFCPRELLFYACANWRQEGLADFVKMMEDGGQNCTATPGLIKDSRDALGHDALWYTLYQPDRFASTTPNPAVDELCALLIERGCDPDWKNNLGLSYNDIVSAK